MLIDFRLACPPRNSMISMNQSYAKPSTHRSLHPLNTYNTYRLMLTCAGALLLQIRSNLCLPWVRLPNLRLLLSTAVALIYWKVVNSKLGSFCVLVWILSPLVMQSLGKYFQCTPKTLNFCCGYCKFSTLQILSDVALLPSQGRSKNGFPLKIYTVLSVHATCWKECTHAISPYLDPPKTNGSWLLPTNDDNLSLMCSMIISGDYLQQLTKSPLNRRLVTFLNFCSSSYLLIYSTTLPRSDTLKLLISIQYQAFTRGPTLAQNLLRQQGPLSSPPLLSTRFRSRSQGHPTITISPQPPSLINKLSRGSSVAIFVLSRVPK